MTADTDRNLLFGLLALQNGMITRDQLVAAFGAWTGRPGRSIADYLVDQRALTPSRRALLDALAAEHVAAHGGDPEASLASLEVGSSTRDTLVRFAGAGVESSLARVGTASRGDTGGMSAGDAVAAEVRWRRVCEAFAAVLRKDPDGRAAHVEHVCGGDLAMRAEVIRLLAADEMVKNENLLDVNKTCASLPGGDPSMTTTLFPADTAANADHRFRLIRLHARGGLGAVFVAVDTELNREVAIKQILDRHADDPSCRQRFLIEAEITGGLEHPGIVPVYSLGVYDDGRPYYAMRFIKGESLREAIVRFHAVDALKAEPGRRSLELRKLLRRFTDVCNAIEYAHSRGVLHRDIKPGNVIVGRYGETLVVDWGVAKPLGHAAPEAADDERTLVPSVGSGSAETLPGSAVGTPAYMSPEQAIGDIDRLGPRSDVYSLGATLYCVLTGQAPFHGDVDEVIRDVQQGNFPSPRRLDPSIDRALEAVCLKAMSANPEDRFPSCRALAEELERWAADEPVTAYRDPLARRARRWAKRHRTAVTGVAVALVAGLIGLSAVLAVQTRANAELVRSRFAVQARYDLAVDAIETFHTGVSEDFLLKQDQFKELRDRLLNSAADFYGKLRALLGTETDFASRRALARANFDLANLRETIGRIDDALAAHRAALASRRALASDPAADLLTKADVGLSLTAIAHILASTDTTVEAESTYRNAEALLANLTATAPASGAARAALARCRSQLGDLLSRTTRRSADAMEVYRLAEADQEAPATRTGATNEARRDLADTIRGIGNLLKATGKTTEAEAELRKAVAIRRKLADDNPAVTQFRSELATTVYNLGIALADMGKLSEAEAQDREAMDIQQKLADDYAAVTEFRSRLAQSHNNLGILLMHKGDPLEAESEYRKSLELRQKLVDDNARVIQFRSLLAGTHHNLGVILLQTGRHSQSVTEFRKAIAIQQKLVDDNPGVTQFRAFLANHISSLGGVLRSTGEPKAAEAAHRRALALRQKLVADNPAITQYRSSFAADHYNLGEVLTAVGRRSEAEAAFREALTLFQKLTDDDRGVPIFRSRLAQSGNDLGSVLALSGNRLEAEAEYRKALTLFQKLADEYPAVTDYRASLAGCQTDLAELLGKAGRRDESRAAYERAQALLEPLVKDHPEVTEYRAGLAATYRVNGQVRLDAADPPGALRAWRRAVELYDGLQSLEAKQMFSRSCCHAGLFALARRPHSGVSAGEGREESEKAMSSLRQAVAFGYCDPNAYAGETALDPLRDRDDFRLLMMDLAMPGDPFAHGD